MFKNLFHSFLFFFIVILISTLFLTLFHYFDIVGTNIISFLKKIIPIVTIFISGYKVGNNSEKKGYLEGIKIGGLIIMIFVILLLLLNQFTLKSLLYYFILLLTSVLGSMVGINKKKATS